MSDQDIQETEPHNDIENDEIVSEAQEPKAKAAGGLDAKVGKDAEKASVDSVDKAAGSTKKAAARKGDKGKQEPIEKIAGVKTEEVELDFESDLNALVESEATLSDEFRGKAATIFEAAVKSKLATEVNRLEENYRTELDEEIKNTKEDLIEKVDSYLNYVVENWMKENELAIHNGLRTEIAEDFMSKLKELFTESYIDVPDSKVDLVDDLAEQVEVLEGKLNTQTQDAIDTAKILEGYQRDAVINSACADLAETQVVKLKSLVEDVDFENVDTFTNKVKTLKESYFNKKTVEPVALEVDETESGSEMIAESSGVMEQYVTAIRRSQKN
jgi:hypothetical protein